MKSLTNYICEAMRKKFNGFAILKPEFLDVQDDFEDMLEDAGWDIINYKTIKMNLDEARDLYKVHEKEDFYDDLCHYMSSGNCIAYKLYKDCKDPIKDLKKVKDEVRDKYGKDDMKNCMHSSDSKENVEREAEICFKINNELDEDED